MTRVLFLDVDGVLNHRAVFRPGNPHPICPRAFSRLRQAVEKTGSKIVVSSTWRKGDPDGCPYIGKLRSVGVFNYTHEDWRTRSDLPPTGEGILKEWPSRGDEIAEWLSRHPEVESFAIVDDDSDMLDEQKPRFVQTTFDTGLLDEHRDRLISLLSESAP